MQGLHVFESNAGKVVYLESFIPRNHLLRQIEAVVKPSFIRRLTASCYADGMGRPPIDPVVYFHMQLVSYLYGIDSARRLCKDVHFNLAYRWFCRLSLEDDVPDHSLFSKTLDRYGEGIHQQVFDEIVKLCRQHGLVGDACCVITDATLMPIDAALDSLIHDDPELAYASQGRTMAIEPPVTRTISIQTHRTRTDPDATLAQKRGTAQTLKRLVKALFLWLIFSRHIAANRLYSPLNLPTRRLFQHAQRFDDTRSTAGDESASSEHSVPV